MSARYALGRCQSTTSWYWKRIVRSFFFLRFGILISKNILAECAIKFRRYWRFSVVKLIVPEDCDFEVCINFLKISILFSKNHWTEPPRCCFLAIESWYAENAEIAKMLILLNFQVTLFFPKQLLTLPPAKNRHFSFCMFFLVWYFPVAPSIKNLTGQK